jgi:hypothetical protein
VIFARSFRHQVKTTPEDLMRLRTVFALAVGTAAALVIGGSALAAGNDDPGRPASLIGTVSPSAGVPAAGGGADDPAGDDRVHPSRSADDRIRATPTARSASPSPRATIGTDHGRHSGTDDRVDDNYGRRAGSDDRVGSDNRGGSDDHGGDDHGGRSGSDDRGSDDHGRR